jgi:DNA-binding MurR/RpiR family transcriptional regulator
VNDSQYSRFRNFLIPDTQNTLQSASYAHSQGDYDRAEELLDAAQAKIQKCREQLQEDREENERD